ncbi:hypothetical protein [Novosphingobium sp. Gsoil 351]|uniref:hypothetical protein n=1 Tax=Novosphingobium sp. Gsoil 351 TaxID=2675225 RepID=UPI0012B453B6|nr:hypothetical protein [Novosphingobium sp. Gsoil 351]QGN54320.1 hypothetical protein GKE62_06890 [Novosphingobium sp. Gsoil 351]
MLGFEAFARVVDLVGCARRHRQAGDRRRLPAVVVFSGEAPFAYDGGIAKAGRAAARNHAVDRSTGSMGMFALANGHASHERQHQRQRQVVADSGRYSQGIDFAAGQVVRMDVPSREGGKRGVAAVVGLGDHGFEAQCKPALGQGSRRRSDDRTRGRGPGSCGAVIGGGS